MNIDKGPSALGLQHMAARAQEVRKQFTLPSETSSSTNSGNDVSSTGKSLPSVAGQSAKSAAHATGIERAIERLQLNTAKNPDALGLQQALEKLQGRLESPPIVDTEA
jgi:hypothetical protein